MFPDPLKISISKDHDLESCLKKSGQSLTAILIIFNKTCTFKIWIQCELDPNLLTFIDEIIFERNSSL